MAITTCSSVRRETTDAFGKSSRSREGFGSLSASTRNTGTKTGPISLFTRIYALSNSVEKHESNES